MQTDERDRSRFIAVVRGFSLRPFGRIALFLCAAGCLAACTEVVDVTTDSRYAQYNRSTDWAKNEAILLNIVRASKYQPLNFLIYNAYSGSATVSAAASSPAFTIGPDRSVSQKQYGFGQGTLTANAMANGSISVQNLDTQDFYDALLSPVDYTNLYEFQRQGYPRELLFRLFTDYVSIKPAKNPAGRDSFIVYNEPSSEKQCVQATAAMIRRLYGRSLDPDRDKICFEDLVTFALLSGLSSEIRPISASSTSAAASPPAGGGATPKTGSPTTPSASSTTPKSPTSEGRLCFDSALANRAQAEYENQKGIHLSQALKSARYSPVCGTWSSTPSKKSSSSTNPSAGTQKLSVTVTKLTEKLVWDIHTLEEHSIEIGTRSTFSIYNFLGRLMRDQDSDVNMIVDPLETTEDSRVLTVVEGRPVGCFVTALSDIGLYCVPLNGAANTKRTFSILSQLLALKTTTGDLQLQPIFRLLSQ